MVRYSLWLCLAGFLSVANCRCWETQLRADEQALGVFPQLSTQDWPWWRGPTRDGHAPDGRTPIQFGASENVLWKSPIPGRGHSSPIVVGKRVFLQTTDEQNQRDSVLALDLANGELVWSQEIYRGGLPEKIHQKNSHASPTLASDGQRLFTALYRDRSIQVFALDMASGAMEWQRVAGPFDPKTYEYGYAPSPLLYGDRVIVAVEQDGESYLAAFARENGQLLWKTERPSNISYSSPVVAHVGGRDQLLISGHDKITAYDPRDGRLLWETPGTTTTTCGTMVWGDDIVFGSGGYPDSETVAVAADGSGKVLWKNNQRLYEQSLIYVAGYLYGLTDKGVLYCWRGADGVEMWRERLAGPVSASPVYAGGHIYWPNETGIVYVFRPNPKSFQLVAENRVADDIFASPAVAGDRLLLRAAVRSGDDRQEFLFCFGQ